MEQDQKAQGPVKVLILWSGAVVPAYRQFFQELAKNMRVRVLSPKRWMHGSVSFGGAASLERNEPRVTSMRREDAVTARAGTGRVEQVSSHCEFIPTAYLPERSARYWVPALVLHLWTYRPRYLYIMDEMDRPSVTWHALMAKIAWPPIRVVTYCLQNLQAPSYYRWHHRLATRINQILVSKTIAASEEAGEVLKHNGYRGPMRVIPLWGSEKIFVPGEKSAVARFRNKHGIPSDGITLLYAGGLVEAKGLLLLADVLPRFPSIRLVTAGNGPLQGQLQAALGKQLIHLGALEGPDLLEFYQAGDYIILPSLTRENWKEQIGRSLIEGILCGCVALGSDSGHIPELTLFPETTFRQGDANSLAQVLGRLPLAEVDSIRSAQRKNVEDRFTATAVAKRTWKFLEEERP